MTANEWKDIGSAPKDGTLILLARQSYLDADKKAFGPWERYAAYWERDGGHGPGWCTPDGAEIFRATRWHDLPPPPPVPSGEGMGVPVHDVASPADSDVARKDLGSSGSAS